jgi:hypothetical protein
LFTGGKRAKAEVIKDSSDLVNPFFFSSSDGIFDDGVLDDDLVWDTTLGGSFPP